MSELQERLHQLVSEACQYPPGNLRRQQCLTQIIRLAQSSLWKSNQPFYQDALQQTWLYFCRNLCESTTGRQYDPSCSSVITWLNAYLKRRLQDFELEQHAQRKTEANPPNRDRSNEVDERPSLVDHLAAKPDVPPILEAVLAWAKADKTGELNEIHVQDHPEITCQVLILRRLPPETSWKDLSLEFKLPISTLSSFYQRQCRPRLRKFGQSEGYL